MREWISHDTNGLFHDRSLKPLFEYHWYIINTRTFYWPHANKLSRLQESQEARQISRNSKGARSEAGGSSKPKSSNKKRKVSKVSAIISQLNDDIKN